MNKKILFLMCGPAGVGKSSWIDNEISLSEKPDKMAVVSRDTIRFSLISDKQSYFSKENEVFKLFIEEINKQLEIKDIVFVDATHLNEKSRNKVLDRVNLTDVSIIPVNFDVPLNICLIRNSYRTGLQRVPESVIKKMWHDFVPANHNEKYEYVDILNIK